MIPLLFCLYTSLVHYIFNMLSVGHFDPTVGIISLFLEADQQVSIPEGMEMLYLVYT